MCEFGSVQRHIPQGKVIYSPIRSHLYYTPTWKSKKEPSMGNSFLNSIPKYTDLHTIPSTLLPPVTVKGCPPSMWKVRPSLFLGSYPTSPPPPPSQSACTISWDFSLRIYLVSHHHHHHLIWILLIKCVQSSPMKKYKPCYSLIQFQRSGPLQSEPP